MSHILNVDNKHRKREGVMMQYCVVIVSKDIKTMLLIVHAIET